MVSFIGWICSGSNGRDDGAFEHVFGLAQMTSTTAKAQVTVQLPSCCYARCVDIPGTIAFERPSGATDGEIEGQPPADMSPPLNDTGPSTVDAQTMPDIGPDMMVPDMAEPDSGTIDERCNGLDDDGDGRIDEETELGNDCIEIGCRGTIRCGAAGPCAATNRMLPERCNGLDDDCNGLWMSPFADSMLRTLPSLVGLGRLNAISRRLMTKGPPCRPGGLPRR